MILRCAYSAFECACFFCGRVYVNVQKNGHCSSQCLTKKPISFLQLPCFIACLFTLNLNTVTLFHTFPQEIVDFVPNDDILDGLCTRSLGVSRPSLFLFPKASIHIYIICHT